MPMDVAAALKVLKGMLIKVKSRWPWKEVH